MKGCVTYICRSLSIDSIDVIATRSTRSWHRLPFPKLASSPFLFKYRLRRPCAAMRRHAVSYQFCCRSRPFHISQQQSGINYKKAALYNNPVTITDGLSIQSLIPPVLRSPAERDLVSGVPSTIAAYEPRVGSAFRLAKCFFTLRSGFTVMTGTGLWAKQ